MPMNNAKRYAPVTLRNREPIRDVLRDVLPHRGQVLEIGSGSGEHAAFFAASFPEIVWQPSDTDPQCLASIAAWMAEAALPNLQPPLRLDVEDRSWRAVADRVRDVVVSINMIHIAPWSATLALLAGAARVLAAGAPLVLYGPYRIDGATAPSNLEFERWLHGRDPRYGVRELREVEAAAAAVGFGPAAIDALPANNHAVVLRRRGAAPAVTAA